MQEPEFLLQCLFFFHYYFFWGGGGGLLESQSLQRSLEKH